MARWLIITELEEVKIKAYGGPLADLEEFFNHEIEWLGTKYKWIVIVSKFCYCIAECNHNLFIVIHNILMKKK